MNRCHFGAPAAAVAAAVAAFACFLGLCFSRYWPRNSRGSSGRCLTTSCKAQYNLGSCSTSRKPMQQINNQPVSKDSLAHASLLIHGESTHACQADMGIGGKQSHLHALHEHLNDSCLQILPHIQRLEICWLGCLVCRLLHGHAPSYSSNCTNGGRGFGQVHNLQINTQAVDRVWLFVARWDLPIGQAHLP
jgi:hypothetical protein